MKTYNNIVNDYEKDGKHMQSYAKLHKNYRLLKEFPARVMLYEQGLKINANDKRMLDKAVDKAIDDVVDSLNVGADIEKEVSEHMPDKKQVEEEICKKIRRKKK